MDWQAELNSQYSHALGGVGEKTICRSAGVIEWQNFRIL